MGYVRWYGFLGRGCNQERDPTENRAENIEWQLASSDIWDEEGDKLYGQKLLVGDKKDSVWCDDEIDNHSMIDKIGEEHHWGCEY